MKKEVTAINAFNFTLTAVLIIVTLFRITMENITINPLDNLIEGFQIISYDWRYLYVNDSVVEQSKYSKEELLGFTMMEKYPGIDNTELFKTLKHCMINRVSEYMENEFKYPNGTSGWFELRIQPVPDGISILSIDISERKKNEQRKKEYIKGLEEMMFLTSHRVRKPIAHILGVSNLLDYPINSQDEIKQIVGYMKKSALALDTFTKDLTLFIYKMEQKERNGKEA